MAKKGDASKLTLSIAVISGLVGTTAGIFLANAFLSRHTDSHESPFEWAGAAQITKGQEFDGISDLGHLSEADREQYRNYEKKRQAGDYRTALKGFETLMASQKTFPLAYGQAALIHIRFMDSSEADSAMGGRVMSQAMAQFPTHAWLHYVYGCFWEKAGLPDSAKEHYRQAVSLSPQFAYPYIRMGRMQLDQGEIASAARNFKTAISLMEAAPATYHPGENTAIPATESAPFDYLATLYFQSGADDSARMVLEYGQDRGWQTDQLALVQGWLWESRGFLQRADSLYRRLLAKHPGHPEYALALRTLGWKPGRQEAGARPDGTSDAAFAISLLDPLVRKHPGNAPLWTALGQAYYHRGLFGLATESLDSSLKYDSAAAGVRQMRDLAFQAWIGESNRKKIRPVEVEAPVKKSREAPYSPDEAPVVIPGSNALLGTYSVPWGSSAAEVRRAYPKKSFSILPNGNMVDAFVQDGAAHEYLLSFKDGKLWGIRVFVTDSAGTGGDLFGRLIRVKTKISGEGKGTGEATCPGYLPFQGAIWENDDTFEFMAQFIGKENQVRLTRMGREYLPQNRRLCDLVAFLKTDAY
jgi:tetratricopeptide (TPR) repeat protein